MSEEEKKAIEKIKGLTVYFDDYSLLDDEEKEAIETLKEINQAIKCRPYFSIPSDTKLFDTLLNIIEKQQKEIARLKAIIKSFETKEMIVGDKK